jgi:hypothetical protein
LRILLSSLLCKCPNQRNLCRLIVSVIVGFFLNHINRNYLKQSIL